MDHEVKQLRDFCLESKRFFVHVYCHIHTSSIYAHFQLLPPAAAELKRNLGTPQTPAKGCRAGSPRPCALCTPLYIYSCSDINTCGGRINGRFGEHPKPW